MHRCKPVRCVQKRAAYRIAVEIDVANLHLLEFRITVSSRTIGKRQLDQCHVQGGDDASSLPRKLSPEVTERRLRCPIHLLHFRVCVVKEEYGVAHVMLVFANETWLKSIQPRIVP